MFAVEKKQVYNKAGQTIKTNYNNTHFRYSDSYKTETIFTNVV